MVRHEPFRIIFICTGNAARSQMAEGLANHLGAGRMDAYSAGTHPSGLSPHAVAAMRERGIDIARHYSKRIDDVPGPFDLVVTLCDHAAQLCPASVREYPMEHWSTPDPTFVPGGPESVHQAFRQVRDRLEGQIQALIDKVRPAARRDGKAVKAARKIRVTKHPGRRPSAASRRPAGR